MAKRKYNKSSGRDYKKEYRRYQGKPSQIKRRAKRNSARRRMEKAGRVRKGDGKDVDHRKPLSRGGSNKTSNLRVQSKSKNRGYKRTKSGKPIVSKRKTVRRKTSTRRKPVRRIARKTTRRKTTRRTIRRTTTRRRVVRRTRRR